MDYGLIGGIGKGLLAGLQTYNEERDRQLKIKQYQDEQEVKGLLRKQQEKQAKMEQFSKGIEDTPEGGLQYTPEQQEMKGLERDYKRAQITGLLAKAKESREKALTPEQLKISGEMRSKVGGLASSLDTLDELENVYRGGGKLSYVSSETPVIGQFMSDKPVDIATRKLADDIGRLRSGGAINKDEEARFRNMLPRPGDNKQIAMQKIASLREEFKTRSGAIGVEDPAGRFGRKGLVGSQPAVKIIGGKQYRKVEGGWEEIE